MLRVPTEKKDEIVALKHFRNAASHIELLGVFLTAFAKDNDLLNFPLPCFYEEKGGGKREGTIPVFRIIFDRKLIRELNPEGR